MKIQRVLVATVLAAAVAACQPPVETPMPTAAPSSAAPTTVLPSPTPTPDPTPTPTYPPGTEQAASALENYFEVWDAWAQKPTRDWDHVLKLTTDEAQVKVQLMMTGRMESGLTVVGTLTYRDWAVGAAHDSKSGRRQVDIRVCEDQRGTKKYSKKDPITDNTARWLQYFEMRQGTDGVWRVGDWTNEEASC